jgi:hypothetical protein
MEDEMKTQDFTEFEDIDEVLDCLSRLEGAFRASPDFARLTEVQYVHIINLMNAQTQIMDICAKKFRMVKYHQQRRNS